MSLINDALKKAQMDRQGKDAPAVNSPDVSGVARGGASGGAGRGLLLLLLVLAAAGAGVYFSGVLEGDSPAAAPAGRPAVVAKAPDVAPVAAKAPAESPDAKSAPVAPSAEVAPVPAAPAAVAPTPAEAPVAPPVAPVVPAAPVAPVVPVVPVAPAEPAKNPAVATLVSLMQVSLTRKNTGRCVIDGVIRKVGETMNANPLIVIESIEDGGVVFRDANGVRYEKSRN